MSNPTSSVELDSSVELIELEEKGNLAIRLGRFDECQAWYLKGLTRAKEMQHNEEAKKFSRLLAALL